MTDESADKDSTETALTTAGSAMAANETGQTSQQIASAILQSIMVTPMPKLRMTKSTPVMEGSDTVATPNLVSLRSNGNHPSGAPVRIGRGYFRTDMRKNRSRRGHWAPSRARNERGSNLSERRMRPRSPSPDWITA